MQETTLQAHTTQLVQLYYTSVSSYEPLLNNCVTMVVCSVCWRKNTKGKRMGVREVY